MDPEGDVARSGDRAQRPRIDLRWPTLRRQFGECVLLPALALALPWSLAWRAMRALATRERLFGRETREAQVQCGARGFVRDRRSWRQRHRLTRMVDHVDPAISAMRSDRWLARHLSVSGDPIPAGPCLFIGFHYGTAFWSLRHLRRLRHRVAFVSAPIGAHARSEPLRFAYTRWRQKQVAIAGGAPVIYVGGSGERIRAALCSGVSVLALIDVPEPTTPTVAVRVLDHEMQLPDGIVRIGAAAGVPLIGFIGTLDAQSGARRLRFTRLPSEPAAALRALAAMLDAAIRDDPAAWHFWGQWPRLVTAPAASPSDAAGVAVKLR